LLEILDRHALHDAVDVDRRVRPVDRADVGGQLTRPLRRRVARAGRHADAEQEVLPGRESGVGAGPRTAGTVDSDGTQLPPQIAGRLGRGRGDGPDAKGRLDLRDL